MSFTAAYKTKCAKCGGEIVVGERVIRSRFAPPGPRGGRKLCHATCGDVAPQPNVIPPAPTEDEDTPQETVSAKPVPGNEGALLDLLAEALVSRFPSLTTPSIDEEKVREIARAAVVQPLRITITRNGETYDLPGTAHAKMPSLLYHVSRRENSYLWGPSQSGKSTAAQQAAEANGLPFYYVSLNPQTPDSRLIGYNDANGRYIETVFYKAYRDGGVICLDEVDNASDSLLTTLNSALANGHGSFPCGMVPRHKDCVVIATGNTPGTGPTAMYPGRRPLDGAFRERFVMIPWEYDETLESVLVTARNPKNADRILTYVRAVRAYAREKGIRILATPTCAMRLAEWSAEGKVAFADALEYALWKGTDKTTVTQVRNAMRDTETSLAEAWHNA